MKGGCWCRILWPLLGAYLACAAVVGYKPVIIVHGLFDSSRTFGKLSTFIRQSHPGTEVFVFDVFDNGASLTSMWKQVEGFKNITYPVMQNATDGVHFICFSQGGLICRGLLSIIPDHNVHTFISLAAPQAGQYGDTEYLRHFFPHFIKSKLYIVCYNTVGQELSICNYWNDPHHRDQYLKNSKYLALLNSERPHLNTSVWKANFLRINKLVLIGGPDDGVITPWQSSHFGFYNEKENTVEMEEEDLYVKDLFGLKTLNTRGDLVICAFNGVHHTEWHSNETVYRGCIEKWLT
ncbi:lysosomal thioesterase PPT2-A-like [Scleropages formosus]|uniref:palmitoyl-CoA hydrolase n=1 Tax=Scleropages formosus TaxID=113540 RepID=A0A8C9S695_SCLFO|nr:lysosomal thioesterase PPT2-A-like [Scleropages formosus]